MSKCAACGHEVQPLLSKSEIRRRAVQDPEKLAERYYALQEEVRIARERLGPAGWKILEEYKRLKEKEKECQIAR